MMNIAFLSEASCDIIDSVSTVLSRRWQNWNVSHKLHT